MLPQSGLPSVDIEHIRLLLSEWQLLADLSFADLLLWVRHTDGDIECVAQVRPTTGPTSYQEDLVGLPPPRDLGEQIEIMFGPRSETDEHDAGAAAEAFAVRRRPTGPVIGVLTRRRKMPLSASSGALEIAYMRACSLLLDMVAFGGFPASESASDMLTGPRAGDGLLLLDEEGRVEYASPNAISAYRRMGLAGDLIRTTFAEVTAPLIRDSMQADEVGSRIRAAVGGASPHRIEVDGHGASVLYRLLPLRSRSGRSGALVLMRDVTDLRRRDRQLMSKDATIREIHHRVKNNLQTVAALLRLQARRVEPQLRTALTESVRRVSSIALVHETLSMSIDEAVEFDTVVDRLFPMLADVAATQAVVEFDRLGWFGVLPAEVATPLVLVIVELLQNAVEHAFPTGETGVVTVIAERVPGELTVEVTDSGVGLPPGFELRGSDSLGLQIASTLIETELRGRLELCSGGDTEGTTARLVIPLRPRSEPGSST